MGQLCTPQEAAGPHVVVALQPPGPSGSVIGDVTNPPQIRRSASFLNGQCMVGPLPSRRTSFHEESTLAEGAVSDLTGIPEQQGQDLDAKENQAYGFAFKCFSTGGIARSDESDMREFVLANTALAPEELDDTLRRAASDLAGGLRQDGFLRLLRDHAAPRGAIAEHFHSVSASGEKISSEDCREGLLCFARERLKMDLRDDTICKAADFVMAKASESVSGDLWALYCGTFCRHLRLVHYLELN